MFVTPIYRMPQFSFFSGLNISFTVSATFVIAFICLALPPARFWDMVALALCVDSTKAIAFPCDASLSAVFESIAVWYVFSRIFIYSDMQ